MSGKCTRVQLSTAVCDGGKHGTIGTRRARIQAVPAGIAERVLRAGIPVALPLLPVGPKAMEGCPPFITIAASAPCENLPFEYENCPWNSAAWTSVSVGRQINVCRSHDRAGIVLAFYSSDEPGGSTCGSGVCRMIGNCFLSSAAASACSAASVGESTAFRISFGSLTPS